MENLNKYQVTVYFDMDEEFRSEERRVGKECSDVCSSDLKLMLENMPVRDTCFAFHCWGIVETAVSIREL